MNNRVIVIKNRQKIFQLQVQLSTFENFLLQLQQNCVINYNFAYYNYNSSKPVQKHQNAKPGSLISTATTVLRDLYWAAKQTSREAFFILIDFHKAFDSVDHSWLYRVLHKTEFPHKFIEIVKKLNFNASSKILINGYQSEKIIIKKGVRQDDTLSLFLSAVEPMLATINHTAAIQGIGVGKNQNIKCPSHADD